MAQAVKATGRVGQVRGPLTFEVGEHDQAIGSRRGGKCQARQLLLIDSKDSGRRLEDTGGS